MKRYSLQLCLVDDDNTRVAEHTFQTCLCPEALEEVEALHNISIEQELERILIREAKDVLIEHKQLEVALSRLMREALKKQQDT